MKRILLVLALLGAWSGFAQLNLDSLGHVNYITLHSTELNDVWGYVDEAGNEYALVGARTGTSIVDVTDPANPNEIFWEPGGHSTWRDLKTFGDYAYVTTEAQDGLLIIDMAPLPASTALTPTYYSGDNGLVFGSAHNLYIDSAGYLYLFGANFGNGGVHILDVHTTPGSPTFVGFFDNWYVHDGYVRNDTMFLAHINDGFISMVDVTDKSNPVLLGTKTTPNTFSHNVWPTNDGNYAFTTDELPYSYIGAYDVSDPANIVEVDRIQSTPGAGVIPHNAHVLNNFLVTSHYSDGIVVHDITYPYNMVEVGEYDTYPGQTTGYDGCWGAYPYLPSGNVLATDISEGLFILGATYQQAAYLEGTVTDASTTNPIDQVEIVITGDNQIETTNNVGFYATGYATGGTYDVTYSKVGYFPQTISTTLVNGVITTQDVQLVPIPPYNLTVTVLEAGTNNPIDNADIRLKATLLAHDGSSNALGEESFTLFYEEDYEVIVGHWGHVTTCFTQAIDNTTGSITVYLDRGYYDDFSFDFGWSASGTVSTGMWERGEPLGAGIPSAPTADFAGDCGAQAYVTENLPFDDGNTGDVDGGFTLLTSPVMDLTGITDPFVNYRRWFYSEFGTLETDSLRVSVSNGTDMVQIDIIGGDQNTFGTWNQVSVRLLDHITITSTMQFFFRTSDFDGSDNITEAGVDHFVITDGNTIGLEEKEVVNVIAYPNPTSGWVTIDNLKEPSRFELMTLNGAVMQQGMLSPTENRLNLTDLPYGVYLLKVEGTILRIQLSN